MNSIFQIVTQVDRGEWCKSKATFSDIFAKSLRWEIRFTKIKETIDIYDLSLLNNLIL
jgi:hypothetical protein